MSMPEEPILTTAGFEFKRSDWNPFYGTRFVKSLRIDSYD